MDLSYLTSQDFETVYEPSDDSYLLIDALTKDFEFIQAQKPLIGVEIGCGSGIVIGSLAQLLGKAHFPTTFLAIDINWDSCMVAKKAFGHNSLRGIDVVNTNLLDNLNIRLQGKVDLLLFNPPYVPTGSDEILNKGISTSYAGGEKGTQVLFHLLPQLHKLLSKQGLFYLVVLKENDPLEIAHYLAKYKFFPKIIKMKQIWNERLSVLRFSRKCTTTTTTTTTTKTTTTTHT